ncbi:MAG: DUF3810 domain-containing protein [Flavobacteriaceae bacterium]|nr:DUF3810 domain-containing protein [Flavobacteriaceae bacterium]
MSRILYLYILLAQIVLFFVFGKISFIIKLNEDFFEIQKKIHQQIFAWIPFSVGDLGYIILGVVLIYFLIKILKKKTRKSYLPKLLLLLNILYFVYQISWGLLYFQEPLIRKLPKEEPDLAEVKSLALKYLEICKEERKHLSEDENGVFKITDLAAIKTEILKNQHLLPKNITQKQATEILSFKPSLFRKIMSDTGILGYYNPFSAEAQYNPELPATYLPFTLAHESSHQLGFAREQEANFIGFLIGKNSENPELKYSTDYFVLKSLLRSLAEKHPDFVENILENFSPEMQKDRLFEKKFSEEHDGFLNAFFGFTNNIFLKTNQQEGSITYSYFVDLLVRYERI